MRPRLPLTSYEDEKLRPVQRFAKLLSVCGAAVALLAFARGYPEIGFTVVLIMCAYVAAVWSVRLRMLWVTAVLIAFGFVASAYALGRPILGIVAAVLVVGWLAARVGRVAIDPTTLRRLDTDEADPGAVASVAEFEALGFERIGALACDLVDGRTVIANLMIGPRNDRYVVVTDLILNVISTFNGRLLTTANFAFVNVLPERLANELRGATSTELAEAHQTALDVLAASGLAPDRIRAEELLDAHIELERRSIAHFEHSRLRRTLYAFFGSSLGSGSLNGSPASQQRINTWLATNTAALHDH
jgi:hypothetical protein